jgi:serine/threonine protein kinase HipA of HipAB toxin-antitoxin module
MGTDKGESPMTTQPTDPTKDLIAETKDRLHDLIFTAVNDGENARANAACRVASHLIDELVAKLQAMPPPTVKSPRSLIDDCAEAAQAVAAASAAPGKFSVCLKVQDR